MLFFTVFEAGVSGGPSSPRRPEGRQFSGHLTAPCPLSLPAVLASDAFKLHKVAFKEVYL